MKAKVKIYNDYVTFYGDTSSSNDLKLENLFATL